MGVKSSRYAILALLFLGTFAVMVQFQAQSHSASGATGPNLQAGAASQFRLPLALDSSATTFTTTPPPTTTTPTTASSISGNSGSEVPLTGALVLSLVAITAGVAFYAGARVLGSRKQESRR